IEDEIGDVAGHFLGSIGPGIHMAMKARLVAAIADIDLQGFQSGAPDRGKLDFLEQRQRVTHRRPQLRPAISHEACAFVTPGLYPGEQIAVSNAAIQRASAVATGDSMPMRPKPGSLTPGRRRSRPATRPRKFISMPSTQPILRPA